MVTFQRRNFSQKLQYEFQNSVFLDPILNDCIFGVSVHGEILYSLHKITIKVMEVSEGLGINGELILDSFLTDIDHSKVKPKIIGMDRTTERAVFKRFKIARQFTLDID